MKDTTNIFLALAEGLYTRGEDGEDIARQLALAFYEIAKENGNGNSPYAEFLRLTSPT